MTVLEKQEDIDKVPADQPVEIEIKDDAPLVVDAGDGGTKAAEAKPDDPKPEPQVDEGERLLRRQLEEANRQVAAEQRRAWEAEQRRQQAEVNARAGYQTAEQAQYEVILNAIQAAQAESLAAKQDYKQAVVNGDPDGQAEAQEKIATAAAKLVTLEDTRLTFEARVQQQRQQQQIQQQQPRQPRNINEYIDMLPDLIPAERQWLKSHSDALTDQRKNVALQHHFWEAVQTRGHKRGSEGYFKYLEEALGYREPPKVQRQRNPTVAAPVSRDAPSGVETSPNRITLTPEQREAAKISGISDIEYARQLIRYNRAKANGQYSENR